MSNLKSFVRRKLRTAVSGDYCARSRRADWGLPHVKKKYNKELDHLENRLEELTESNDSCTLLAPEPNTNSASNILLDIDKTMNNLAMLHEEMMIKCLPEWVEDDIQQIVEEYDYDIDMSKYTEEEEGEMELKNDRVVKAIVAANVSDIPRKTGIKDYINEYTKLAYPALVDKNDKFYNNLNMVSERIKVSSERLITDSCHIIPKVEE